MYYFVYCTIDLTNGIQYVGIHSTNNKQDGYIGGGTLFRTKLIEHGKHNFKRRILFNCESREEALWIEAKIIPEWLIKRWGNGKYFYNLTAGGNFDARYDMAVKSLDIHGQIHHYETLTATGKHQASILTAIETCGVRYECLWKYEDDNSEWRNLKKLKVLREYNKQLEISKREKRSNDKKPTWSTLEELFGETQS